MSTLTSSDPSAAAHLSKITPTDRKAHGKQLRGAVPRAAHDEWRARQLRRVWGRVNGVLVHQMLA
jgi:hypothetical protein